MLVIICLVLFLFWIAAAIYSVIESKKWIKQISEKVELQKSQVDSINKEIREEFTKNISSLSSLNEQLETFPLRKDINIIKNIDIEKLIFQYGYEKMTKRQNEINYPSDIDSFQFDYKCTVKRKDESEDVFTIYDHTSKKIKHLELYTSFDSPEHLLSLSNEN